MNEWIDIVPDFLIASQKSYDKYNQIQQSLVEYRKQIQQQQTWWKSNMAQSNDQIRIINTMNNTSSAVIEMITKNSVDLSLL